MKSIFFEFKDFVRLVFNSKPTFLLTSAIIAVPLFLTIALINPVPIKPAPPVTTIILSFNKILQINFQLSLLNPA